MAIFQGSENKNSKSVFDGVNTKSVLRYTMMPEILPRIRALGLHFGHFAYLLALVFSSARLIPATHPAVNAANIGRYGVRQVIAIAANNITWSKNNIDQIGIFTAIVLGLIMIVIQAFLIAFAALVGFNPAEAAPPSSFFETPSGNVQTDVVLIFLEQVFGPNLNFFGAASQPLSTPVYEGVHAMLSLYSMAMMVIAVIIVLYYIMTVVGEAAKTGTPFGQRFNTLWAPIRLVVALGLLVPLGSGLNSAQYLTLWTAKMGSGLGTQIWITFIEEVTATQNILAKPSGDSTGELVRRIFLNEVCAASYNKANPSGQQVIILQTLGSQNSINADFSNPQNMINSAKSAGDDDVAISWSRSSAGGSANDNTCGRLSVSLSEFDVFSDGENVSAESQRWWWYLPLVGRDMEEKLGQIHSNVKNAYISEIGRLASILRPAGVAVANYGISINASPEYGNADSLVFIEGLLREQSIITNENINNTIVATYDDMAQSEYATAGGYDEMIKRGWGAAGLWYGTLGTINKKYMEALASAIPSLDILFEADDVGENNRWAFAEYFNLRSRHYDVPGDVATEIEQTIDYANTNFSSVIMQSSPTSRPLYEDARYERAHQDGESGWLANSIIFVLGSGHLSDLKDDPSLDPMIHLSTAGHNMITKALVFAGLGTAFGIGSAIVPDERASAITGAIASVMFAIAVIGVGAGVFLAYILPIIPFMYFAVAVIGWVLEIFEAVVAMPLWALAHLRIDGDGMPGGAAIGGYHLLLMILLRPGLIVVGLVGGYVIFGAAIYYFSTLFNSAVSITQSDIADNSLGAIGQVVYTVVYVFIVYNIALSCFKMIDDVPKGMLRWLQGNGAPFSDTRPDPIGGSKEAAFATAAAGTALASSLKNSSSGIVQAIRKKQPNLGEDAPGSGNPLSGAGGGGGTSEDRPIDPR